MRCSGPRGQAAGDSASRQVAAREAWTERRRGRCPGPASPSPAVRGPPSLHTALTLLVCTVPGHVPLRVGLRGSSGGPSCAAQAWPGAAACRCVLSSSRFPPQVLKGTVTDFPGFDERADAETLRKAMKGLGEFSLPCVLENTRRLVLPPNEKPLIHSKADFRLFRSEAYRKRRKYVKVRE